MDFDYTDGTHHALVSDNHSSKSSGSYSNSAQPKTRNDSSQTSGERIKNLAAFQPPDSSFSEDLSASENDHGKQILTCTESPFSLILPRSISSTHDDSKWIETENNLESCYEVLKSGMFLLKNYLSLSDQPDNKKGRKLRLHMMCLGRKWDPQTKYSSKAATQMIPDKLISMVKMALERSQSLSNSDDELPSMFSDICLVNFYTTAGGLALHQDRDESWDSLNRGLPVVSISIGDGAEFLYADKGALKKAEKVVLESCDVLIFGGKSRLVFHGGEEHHPEYSSSAIVKTNRATTRTS